MPLQAVQISLPSYKKGHEGQLKRVFDIASGSLLSYALLVAKNGLHAAQIQTLICKKGRKADLFQVDTPGYFHFEKNGAGKNEPVQSTFAVRVLTEDLRFIKEKCNGLEIVATVKSPKDLSAVLLKDWDKSDTAERPSRRARKSRQTPHVAPEAAQPTAAP